MEKAYLITQNTKKNTDFNSFQRVYIWDQYCEYNMFFFLNDPSFINWVLELWKKITITTPVISENWLKNFKLFLNNFMENIWDNNNYWIEIVVNDFWVLNLVQKKYKNINIVWWNFLSWQNKDPFLKNFKDKEEHKKISINSNYYKQYFKENNIKTIELYNTFQWIDIDMENISINMYYPFVVFSITRYCTNALINKWTKYLEIVENCSWCKNIKISNLSTQEKNIEQFLRWNKQFYKNETKPKNKINRIIYNYDLLNDWQ